MTTEELMALLRDPDQTGQSVNELNRLIEEYSYFHTGHQLYLQSLKKTDETQLVHQLGKSAINVRDRGLLYNYINRPSLFRQQTSDPQGEIETPPFVPGNAFVSPETDILNIRNTEIPANNEPLDFQSLSVGVDSFRKSDDDSLVSAEEKIMTNEELMSIIQRQLEQISGEVTTKAPEETIVPEVNIPEAIVPKPVIVPQTPAAETEIKLAGDPFVLSDQLVEFLNPKPATTQDVVVKHKTNDLIDSFLKINPKIIPSVVGNNYEVDLTSSLQENQNMATETLADIYVSQGHILKAIEIYEHLILKYPEKHIYFAAQVDRLKQESK